MLRNSKDETTLLFSSKNPNSLSLVDDQRSVSVRDPVVGLTERGQSRRGLPRKPAGPPRLQYYANRTKPYIFITSRRARIKD